MRVEKGLMTELLLLNGMTVPRRLFLTCFPQWQVEKTSHPRYIAHGQAHTDLGYGKCLFVKINSVLRVAFHDTRVRRKLSELHRRKMMQGHGVNIQKNR